MEGGEDPLERRVLSPSKPPPHPENFPTGPRRFESENLFCFLGWRGSVGKFLLLGELEILREVRLRTFLVGGAGCYGIA